MGEQDAVIRHALRDLAADPRQVQPQGIVEPAKDPSLWQAFKEKLVTDVMPTMHAAAKAGAKDLYNGIIPAFPDSVKGVDEPGMPLTPTQFMVNADFREYEAELDAAARRPQQEQSRELER